MGDRGVCGGIIEGGSDFACADTNGGGCGGCIGGYGLGIGGCG